MRWCMLCLVSVAMLGFAMGCAPKVTTVHSSERIEESEPQMVSPGEEIVE